MQPSGPRGNCARWPPRRPAGPRPGEGHRLPPVTVSKERLTRKQVPSSCVNGGSRSVCQEKRLTFTGLSYSVISLNSGSESRLAGTFWFERLGVFIQNSRQLVLYEVQVRLVPFYLKDPFGDPVKSIERRTDNKQAQPKCHLLFEIGLCLT